MASPQLLSAWQQCLTLDGVFFCSCCMLMEFIPGRGMFKSEEAFSPQAILQTAEDLGRMFTLGAPGLLLW